MGEGKAGNVHVVNVDSPVGRADEAEERRDKCTLTGTRSTHDSNLTV